MKFEDVVIDVDEIIAFHKVLNDKVNVYLRGGSEIEIPAKIRGSSTLDFLLKNRVVTIFSNTEL